MTDAEIMAHLREVPRSMFDDSVQEHFLKCDPGADGWRAYELIGTDCFLIFTFNGELTMQSIREGYQKHVESLPTVGGTQ
jgi:hypothetical protein